MDTLIQAEVSARTTELLAKLNKANNERDFLLAKLESFALIGSDDAQKILILYKEYVATN